MTQPLLTTLLKAKMLSLFVPDISNARYCHFYQDHLQMKKNLESFKTQNYVQIKEKAFCLYCTDMGLTHD